MRHPCLFLVWLVLATVSRAASEVEGPTHVLVPMRDGVRLTADVYLPAASGPFPVLLGRTPYGRAASAGFGRDGARRGYAVVVQDTRGRHGAEGENLPFDRDMADGADTMSWLAAQAWCDGRVGTWGGSAGAITQFQLAASGPANLVSQHLVVGAADLHGVAYVGGVFRKAMIEDWIRVTAFQEDALARWLAHPAYDAYWRERDAMRHLGKVRAAGLHVGGYWDIFAQATLDAFVGYQERGGKGARGRQKLLMGPWTHSVLQERAGELSFPGASRPPNRVHDTWRWFDATIKGLSNGVAELPAVTYYVVGAVGEPGAPGNLWRTAATWPPFDVKPTALHLHGDRTLHRARPREATPQVYVYDPARPAPTVGGVQLTLPSGPMDQRSLESRDDVLVFTSETLADPVEVTGRIRARLWVSSDAPDTDFLVKLCDVYPDGRSFNVCEGALRARYRRGLDREVPMRPGRPEQVEVDCWSTSIVFNRGHRLRVIVTSSSAPGHDPNPNTGDRLRLVTARRPAENSVWTGGTRASHILLPVVTGALP